MSRIKKKRPKNPVHIVAYRGYGDPHKIFLKGRVLENKNVGLSTAEDSAWKNLRNVWKRFESDEIPGARVLASLMGVTKEVTADKEGYFTISLQTSEPLSDENLWHTLNLELLSPVDPALDPAHEAGLVMIPPKQARFGVISDMDDTVLQSDATNILRMIKTVALGNARTRMPFKGVAAFYQALQEENGKPTNPLFYVSSSPWNLYDLLMEFFHLQNIPVGPLMLRDWGASRSSLPHKHRDHKVESIRHILDLWPLPF